MRPQVISYLLVALTTAAWMRTREDGRARWWLIPMTWVWAMCHGMWPIGIVIGLVALVGIAADRTADRRDLLRLSAIPVGSAVVAALTPVGPALYPAVLLVGGRGQVLRRVGTRELHAPGRSLAGAAGRRCCCGC